MVSWHFARRRGPNVLAKDTGNRRKILQCPDDARGMELALPGGVNTRIRAGSLPRQLSFSPFSAFVADERRYCPGGSAKRRLKALLKEVSDAYPVRSAPWLPARCPRFRRPAAR